MYLVQFCGPNYSQQMNRVNIEADVPMAENAYSTEENYFYNQRPLIPFSSFGYYVIWSPEQSPYDF